LDAAGVVDHVHSHAPAPQQVFLTPERNVLADHDARDAVEQNRPGAHRARRRGRVQDTSRIHGGPEPAGVFQSVHLTVEDSAAPLHAAIVPPPDDLTFIDEDGSDRDAALGQPSLRLDNRRIEELVHGPSLLAIELDRAETRIRFTRVLVGLKGPESSFPSTESQAAAMTSAPTEQAVATRMARNGMRNQ